MAKQVYFDDVNVGDEIPKLVKHPTPRQLVKWAGASGDYNEIHYNIDVAKKQGLPDIIVHGRLKAAFLGNILSNFAGLEGSVKKFSCSYRGMDIPGTDMTVGGKVVKKYTEGRDNLVDLELSILNIKGETTTIGAGTVILPAKK